MGGYKAVVTIAVAFAMMQSVVAATEKKAAKVVQLDASGEITQNAAEEKGSLKYQKAKKIVQKFWQDKKAAESSVTIDGDGAITNKAHGGADAIKAAKSLIRSRSSGTRRRRVQDVANEPMPCPGFYSPGDMEHDASVEKAEEVFQSKCQADGHDSTECDSLGKDIFEPMDPKSQPFKDKADDATCAMFLELVKLDNEQHENKAHEETEDGDDGDGDLLQHEDKDEHEEADEHHHGSLQQLQKRRKNHARKSSSTLDASSDDKCGDDCTARWDACYRRRDCSVPVSEGGGGYGPPNRRRYHGNAWR